MWTLSTSALELGGGLVDQTQITPEVQDKCFIALWLLSQACYFWQPSPEVRQRKKARGTGNRAVKYLQENVGWLEAIR